MNLPNVILPVMKMEFSSNVLVLLVVFCICNGSHATIYYSGKEKLYYNDGEAACGMLSGHMLPYGQAFIQTLMQCEPYVYVWVGLPFYKHLQGCYKGKATLITPEGSRQEDKRLAICADFCSEDDYQYIGLTTTECHCYTLEDFQSLEYSQVCQIPSCPGNLYDICGVVPYAIVYQKVRDFGIGSCHSRNIYENSFSHRSIGFCMQNLPFICKIGQSADISCTLPDNSTESTTPHEPNIPTKDSTHSSYRALGSTTTTTTTTTTENNTPKVSTSRLQYSTNDLRTSKLATGSVSVSTTQTYRTSTTAVGGVTQTPKMSAIQDEADDDTILIVIVVTCVLAVLGILLLIIILIRSRKKRIKEDSRPLSEEPSVHFNNLENSDSSVSYSTVTFKTDKRAEPEDLSKQKTLPNNGRSQMYKEDFVFYEQDVITE